MTGWQLIETAPKDGKFFLGAKNLGVGYGWVRYICRWSKFKKVLSLSSVLLKVVYGIHWMKKTRLPIGCHYQSRQ